MGSRWVRTTSVVLAVALAACGDDEVADISYEQLRDAAAAGDAASFKTYFEEMKGKRVAWQGQVAEARREMEDDYMQTGVLLVDMDAAQNAGPDVVFKVSPDRLPEFQPGQPVKFTAVIREYELVKGGGLLLKLQAKEVQ